MVSVALSVQNGAFNQLIAYVSQGESDEGSFSVKPQPSVFSMMLLRIDSVWEVEWQGEGSGFCAFTLDTCMNFRLA